MEPISPETKRLAARGMQLQADAMRRSLRNASRLLDRYADAAESQGKERIENAVLDLMDSVSGFCHSRSRVD